MYPARPATLGAALLDLILPRHCLVCARPAGSAPLCTACQHSLPHLPPHACPRCAHPHSSEAAKEALCGACLAQPPAFDAALARYVYAAPVDHLIAAVKYHRRLAVADFLAHELSHWPNLATLPAVDCIVPMPLSAQRLAQRGFNQAHELARPLAQRLACRIDLAAVARPRDTPAQVGLPWRQRAQNMRHAFAGSARLDGQHVLLVDDVMTTGASLDALATQLKRQGAARVSALVVARSVRNG